MKKNKPNITQEERPEPFATVMELAFRYGKLAVLESLTNLVEFDSEDPSFSDQDREADAILHVDLSMALDQYSLFFAEPEPEVQVNRYGGELVQ